MTDYNEIAALLAQQEIPKSNESSATLAKIDASYVSLMQEICKGIVEIMEEYPQPNAPDLEQEDYDAFAGVVALAVAGMHKRGIKIQLT